MLQQLEGVFRCATSARVYPRTVGVGVGVGVGEGVEVGETIGVGVGEGVGVGVGVTTRVGVGEIVGVGVGLGVGLGVGVEEGVGESVGEGAGDAFTATPLLQTRLLPFFKQVNSRFFEITTVPTFLHVAPALGVFAAALFNELAIRNAERRKIKLRRISEF